MARHKAYKEEEVIKKATKLFWRKGYANTSMRELEETMGINKFSIYSSFGNKQQIFIQSIQCYRNQIQKLLDKLSASPKGVEAIKEYFYDFLEFSKVGDLQNGCLIANTMVELGADGDAFIMNEIHSYGQHVKSIFIQKLKTDPTKSEKQIEKEANFLLVAVQGLSNSSILKNKETIDDFIELTFEFI